MSYLAATVWGLLVASVSFVVGFYAGAFIVSRTSSVRSAETASLE